MQELDIFLFPDGEEESELRANVPSFRKTVFQSDYQDALLARATIAGLTHGTLDPTGDEATLLILEFRFISMKKSRRFTSCNITVTFEDSGGDDEMCPEVYKVVPEGAYALNKTTATRDVKIGANAGVNVGVSPAGANAGITWEVAEAKNRDNWTTLAGSRKELGGHDKDDAVVWAMSEDVSNKTGIPSFLRTAVLLRRESAVPFNLLVNVRAQVDSRLSLFGRERASNVSNPVGIDSSVDPKLLKVSTIDAKTVDLTNMDNLDLWEFADVTLITVM